MRRSSGMQKVLCGTIFLNQVRNSYIVMKPHNSSTEVLAEPNESATKPSSGFVLKDIKSCIFQIPSNPCVLIKNVVWPVNFCRGLRLCYSVLENGEKKNRQEGWVTTGFPESRRATQLRCDTCHNHISGRLKSNQFHAWRAVVGWDKPTEPTATGMESCAQLVECPRSSSKRGSPAPYASHTTSVKCLSSGTYHMLFV